MTDQARADAERLRDDLRELATRYLVQDMDLDDMVTFGQAVLALAAAPPAEPSAPRFDPSNHHNALACPYCNPRPPAEPS